MQFIESKTVPKFGAFINKRQLHEWIEKIDLKK